MSADERGNELAAADYHIEYIVHGKFKRSQIDQNGIYEAGWVPLRKLVKEVGREIVKQEIMIFESSLHDVCEAELEEISSDDDDSDSDSDNWDADTPVNKKRARDHRSEALPPEPHTPRHLNRLTSPRGKWPHVAKGEGLSGPHN